MFPRAKYFRLYDCEDKESEGDKVEFRSGDNEGGPSQNGNNEGGPETLNGNNYGGPITSKPLVDMLLTCISLALPTLTPSSGGTSPTPNVPTCTFPPQ